jgi:hypothetical protein
MYQQQRVAPFHVAPARLIGNKKAENSGDALFSRERERERDIAGYHT